MGQRRKFSAEYKREAVAMLASAGVSVSQIAAELGIGANVQPVAFPQPSSHSLSGWGPRNPCCSPSGPGQLQRRSR